MTAKLVHFVLDIHQTLFNGKQNELLILRQANGGSWLHGIWCGLPHFTSHASHDCLRANSPKGGSNRVENVFDRLWVLKLPTFIYFVRCFLPFPTRTIAGKRWCFAQRSPCSNDGFLAQRVGYDGAHFVWPFFEPGCPSFFWLFKFDWPLFLTFLLAKVANDLISICFILMLSCHPFAVPNFCPSLSRVAEW